MMGLDTIITDQSIKAVASKSEGLIKRLFGKAFDETGEIIADQVRLRRFKNQIKIFEKATDYLKDKNFDHQKINLKVLAPLIEFSSYEDDESLQEIWAKLIKNILTKPYAIVLQQNAVEILNKVSNEEVRILDFVYKQVVAKRKVMYDSRLKWRTWNHKITKLEDIRIEQFSVDTKDIAKALKIENSEIEILVSNLIALGTLKYETEIDVSTAEKSSEDPSDTALDIELDVTDYDKIKMTRLGFVFVELCQE